MAEIADAAAEIYRDFNVDGDPDSGPWKPIKSAIRELFSTIDEEVAAGAPVYGDVSLLDFTEAMPDGIDTGTAFTGTDFTAALQTALNYCSSNRVQLHIPAGKYRIFPPSKTQTPGIAYKFAIEVPTWMHIVADDGAELLIDEDITSDIPAQFLFKSLAYGGSTEQNLYEQFIIEGLTFRGRWSHGPYLGPSAFGVTMFGGQNFKRVELSRVKAFDIRGKGSIFIYNNNCRAERCYYERMASDALRFAECNNIYIDDNTLINVDDDAIACVSFDNVNPDRPVRGTVTITNNRIFGSEGIYCGALRKATVSFNLLNLCHGTAIEVGQSGGSGVTGNAPSGQMTVIGNVVENHLGRYRPTGWPQAEEDGPHWEVNDILNGYVRVGGSIMSNYDTDGVYPGNYYDAIEGVLTSQGFETRSTIPPWGWHLTRNAAPRLDFDEDLPPTESALQTSAGSYDIVVSGNVMVRTLPRANKFSDYGYGQYFDRMGFQDPPVEITNFRWSGLIFASEMRHCIACNNIIRGMRYGAGILFEVRGGSTAEDTIPVGRQFENFLISDNYVSDVHYGFSTNRAGNNNPPFQTFDTCLDGNVFDVDPYLKSPRRNSAINGTWLSSTLSEAPVAINCTGIAGVICTNNKIRNTYHAIAPTIDNDAVLQQVSVDGNCIYCDPAGMGYNAGNVGVGHISQAGAQNKVIIWGGNPQDLTTWNTVKNYCPWEADELPSTGKYIIGHRIRKRNSNVVGPAGSQYTIEAWRRITVGTGHVLNTDWIEQRTLTGT